MFLGSTTALGKHNSPSFGSVPGFQGAEGNVYDISHNVTKYQHRQYHHANRLVGTCACGT